MKIYNWYIKYKLRKYVSRGLIYGDQCRFLGNPSFGSEPYLIRIGNRCTITSGVRFITHDGGTWIFRDNEKYKGIKKYGKIEIGNNCFIGINSIIMPGVTIGDNCVIGAGSVVTKSIPSNSVAAGNPAKIIMTVEEYINRSSDKAVPFNNVMETKREYLSKYFWGEKS